MGRMGIVVDPKLTELRIKQDHAWAPVSTVAGHSMHAKDYQQHVPLSVLCLELQMMEKWLMDRYLPC